MDYIGTLLLLIFTVIAFFYMRKEKNAIPEGQVLQAPLTGKEKVIIGCLCIIDPIIAGAVFYYGWKKQMPVKANQANQISLGVFVLEIVILFATGQFSEM
ncbi:MAG: hypothetical protein WCJ84_02890 [Candidatus Peregrinibacteria bacterium]